MVSLFKKSITPEESKMKLVLGSTTILVGSLVFVFRKFLESISGYSLVTDVLLILFIVLLPIGLLLIYYFIFENGGERND